MHVMPGVVDSWIASVVTELQIRQTRYGLASLIELGAQGEVTCLKW